MSLRRRLSASAASSPRETKKARRDVLESELLDCFPKEEKDVLLKRFDTDDAWPMVPKTAPRFMLACLYVDDMAADRSRPWTLAELLEHYVPRPVYTHAKVTICIDNPWGPGSEDTEILPLRVAQFFDIVTPHISRTRSKHDYVTITWNTDTDWKPTMDGRHSAETWAADACDDWHDQVANRSHGLEAYAYFLAHFDEPDCDDKTLAIWKDTKKKKKT